MDDIVILGNEEPPVEQATEPVEQSAALPLVKLPPTNGRSIRRAGITKNKGKGQSKVRRKMEKASRKQNRKR